MLLIAEANTQRAQVSPLATPLSDFVSAEPLNSLVLDNWTRALLERKSCALLFSTLRREGVVLNSGGEDP